MTHLPSTNRKIKFQGLIMLLAALVLLFLHPADPRKGIAEKLVNATQTNSIPANGNDSQLIAYKKIDDSLAAIFRLKKQRLKENSTPIFFLFAGLNKVNEADPRTGANEKTTDPRYYLSISGFTLKKDAGLRIEENEYIADRFVADSKKNSRENKTGLRVALSANNQDGINVLIPVSRSLYSVMEPILYIFFGLGVIAALWLFIRIPVKLLVNIAEGKPFLEQNIRYLEWIGWSIIVTCLAMTVLPKLIQWLSRIPSDIYFPFWSALIDFRWEFFVAIAVLMTARAFKCGYELQKEQDLTI